MNGLVSQMHIINKAEHNGSMSGDPEMAILGVFIEVRCLFLSHI